MATGSPAARASKAGYKLEPRYGKQSVPLFRLRKQGPHHSIMDMMVKVGRWALLQQRLLRVKGVASLAVAGGGSRRDRPLLAPLRGPAQVARRGRQPVRAPGGCGCGRRPPMPSMARNSFNALRPPTHTAPRGPTPAAPLSPRSPSRVTSARRGLRRVLRCRGRGWTDGRG